MLKEDFQYTRLSTPSSFRLLSIEQSHDTNGHDSVIRVSLQEYNSNEAPKYNALSYTWAIDRSHRKRLMKNLPLISKIGLLAITSYAKGDLSGAKTPARKWLAKIKKPWSRNRRRQAGKEHEFNGESDTVTTQAVGDSLLLHEVSRVSSKNHRRERSERPGVSCEGEIVEEGTGSRRRSKSLSRQGDTLTKLQPAQEAERQPREFRRSISSEESAVLSCRLHRRRKLWQVRVKIRKWREQRKFKRDNPTRLIICNGKRLRIGLNLYNALQKIPSNKAQLWWIDAICIDQSNITERGEQVDLMAQIYANAEEVLVWLGKSSSFTRKAPRFLASLPSFNVPEAQGTSEISSDLSAREEMLFDPFASLRKHMTKWIALLLITRRRWFRRAWVLQEAMLAKEISYRLGPYMISHQNLMNGMDWLEHLLVQQGPLSNPVAHSTMRNTLNSMHTLKTRGKFRSGPVWEVEDYIEAVRGRESSNKRDIVFAGLSLVQRVETKEGLDSVANLLKADYTKSVAQIYQECAQYLLEERLGLRVLSLVESSDEYWSANRDFPSWVPDFAKTLTPVPLWTLGGVSFQAFPSKDNERNHSLNGPILNLQGVQWDEIYVIGEEAGEIAAGFGGILARNKQEGILQILSRLGRYYDPTGEATMTALWRVLIADLFENEHPAPNFLSSSFLRWFVTQLAAAIGQVHESHQSKFMAFNYRMQGIDTSPEGVAAIRANIEEIIKIHSSQGYPFLQAMTDVFSRSDHPVAPITLQTLFPPVTFDNQEQNHHSTTPSCETLPQVDDGIEYSLESAIDSQVNQGRFALSDLAEIWGPMLKHTEPFKSTFDKHCEGRRIFLTKKGYLGLGPKGAQAGDAIILLKGSYVPYIFRKAVNPKVTDVSNGITDERPERDETHWRLVGEAYVHGIMHVEALSGEDAAFEAIHII